MLDATTVAQWAQHPLAELTALVPDWEGMPEDAYLHRSLGRMYEDMGRLEEALAQYRAAATIDTASDFYKDLVSSLEARLAQQPTPSQSQ